MTLSSDRIAELQSILREDFSLEASVEQTSDLGTALVQYIQLLGAITDPSRTPPARAPTSAAR